MGQVARLSVENIPVIGKKIIKQSPIKKQEDLGIDRMAAEINSPVGLAKLVDKLFKAVGINYMDTIGKEALINATINRYQRMAKKGKFNAKFQRRFERAFSEEERAQVIEELKSGEVTENTKYLAFFTLSDFQPLTFSELPKTYLDSPKGRWLYQLKTYTIKQFDVYRREAFTLINEGIKENDAKKAAQGVQNLVHVGVTLTVMNASADLIKDWMYGRDVEWDDLLMDQLFRLMGVSRYITYQYRRYGANYTAYKLIAPPTDIIDTGIQDLGKIKKAITEKDWDNFNIKDLRAIKNVPYGQFYYWYLGAGPEKQVELRMKKRKEQSKSKIFTPKEKREFFQYIDNAEDAEHITRRQRVNAKKAFLANQRDFKIRLAKQK